MNLRAPFEGAERYYLGTGQVEFRPFERRGGDWISTQTSHSSGVKLPFPACSILVAS